MSARLLSSILWMCLLVVAPARELVQLVAVVVWPNKRPFSVVGGVDAPVVPTVALVVVGYLATVFLVRRFLLPRWRGRRTVGAVSGAAEGRTPGFPGVIAVMATMAWLVLLTVQGAMEWHHVAIALLVVVGVLERRAGPVPTPTPRPSPLPIDPDEEDDDCPEDSEDDEFYCRVFEWLFNEEPYRRTGRTHQMQLSLRIPRAIYDDYKGRSHAVHSDADYVRFINEELNDDVVTPLAKKLRRIVVANGFDELAEIHLAMAFTLSFDYAHDLDGEYPKYPVETLVDRDGDCEDHANLCGAVLHGLGHTVALVLMETGVRTGHAALAVEAPVEIPGASFVDPESGRKLFYCEVTPAGDATTKETIGVQWWLGREPMDRAKNFTLWTIK